MKNSTINEAELIQTFMAGDKSVFADLVNPYYLQAYKVAFSVLKQHQDAEDATQNAFIKIYKSLEQFKGQSSFKNWLIRIVRNHAIDLYRSNRRRSKINDNFKEIIKPVCQNTQTAGSANVKEMKSDLSCLIHSVSPTYEKVLKLRFMDSLSYEEISNTLMCSVGTVKSRLARGRKQIRTLMQGAV